ncbi:MAG: rhodanese-like domain-containing protein [Oscillospiraceae bacterium]|nr:rhodanese-like domain-containing protein [Oscillospiraceae bacterium]
MFFFNRSNINDAVVECQNTFDTILVDVREIDEFKSGHIPGAINEPLSTIRQTSLPKDKQLYVYCLRGTRSRQAVAVLKQLGYDAKSIGGIISYKGALER